MKSVDLDTLEVVERSGPREIGFNPGRLIVEGTGSYRVLLEGIILDNAMFFAKRLSDSNEPFVVQGFAHEDSDDFYSVPVIVSSHDLHDGGEQQLHKVELMSPPNTTTPAAQFPRPIREWLGVETGQ